MKKIFAFLSVVFITQSVFAEFVCDTDITDYFAIYKIFSYTCPQGQYLPADTLGCVACPTGFNCPGGTFEYNPNEFQGLDLGSSISGVAMNNICATNFPDHWYPRYTPKVYTCAAGYYLPADGIECAICPANNLCVGGTYTFNETTDQGIVACATPTPYAPTGSSVCYPHILHVGNDNIYLRDTKLTTPSLNIQIGNDIFYANMTTTQTYMNKDSSHYLHILYEGDDYYVCDDTTYQE